MSKISKLTKSQHKDLYKLIEADEVGENYPNVMALVVAHIRHDDSCGNGHNSFAVTGTLYLPQTIARAHGDDVITYEGKRWGTVSGGCIHDIVIKAFPELAYLIPFHLCSTDEPLHYIANTLYHLNPDTCDARYVRNEIINFTETKYDKPIPKEERLRRARDSAIWPDLTEEEAFTPCEKCKGAGLYPRYTFGKGDHSSLLARCDGCDGNKIGLKPKLIARLPKLMTDFREAVERFGFTF